MKSELIIDVQPTEVSIALLEDSRLMSLQKEARNIAYAVGDIYLAKVKKLMPGLNAAFVNVGYEKDAFLHYLDLGAHFASYSQFLEKLLGNDRRTVPQLPRMKLQPDIDKNGMIGDLIQPGRELLVQIVKEPISSKGPRLTTEIAFTGRYMVLIPFGDKVSISQKIKTGEEKARLRQLISSIKPKNFGVIVRTSAEGKRVAELNNELKTLIKCWEDTCAKAQKATAPSLVFEEESRIVGMLRDVFSPSFEAIHVNDEDTYNTILNYVSLIAPERKDIVKLYKRPEPIFDAFAVTRQIKSSFGKTVSFKSGAYIIVEHTEALHVIDVNSGNRTKATNDQETNALEVNLRAADEIARQLRLRDMGGIIVVDFIDMAKNEHRQQLYEHMKEIMGNDRARHNILPLSKFGLMQITRQRVRPALDVAVEESCPSCHGTGQVQPSLLFTDTLYEKIEYAITQLGLNNFKVYVHPFVEAYLKKGWLLSLSAKWRRNLPGKFKIYADQSLAYLQYRILDSQGKEVDVTQEKDSAKASVEKSRDKAKKRGIDTDVKAEESASVKTRKAVKELAKESVKEEAQQSKEAMKPQAKAATKTPQKNKPKPQSKDQAEPKAIAETEEVKSNKTETQEERAQRNRQLNSKDDSTTSSETEEKEAKTPVKPRQPRKPRKPAATQAQSPTPVQVENSPMASASVLPVVEQSFDPNEVTVTAASDNSFSSSPVHFEKSAESVMAEDSSFAIDEENDVEAMEQETTEPRNATPRKRRSRSRSRKPKPKPEDNNHPVESSENEADSTE